MKTWITDTGYKYWEEVDEIEDKLTKEQYSYISDVPMYFIGMEVPLCYDPLMNYFNGEEMGIMEKILLEESIKKDFINRDGFEKIFSCMWGILSEISIDERWMSNPEEFWDDLRKRRKRIDIDNIYID